MSNAPQAALERLIGIAQDDSGQSRAVADFLLAWWNAAGAPKYRYAAVVYPPPGRSQKGATAFHPRWPPSDSSR